MDATMRISPPAMFPTSHGVFQIRVVAESDALQHVVVYKGELSGAAKVPVRIHSECLTSEVFNSLRCDCNDQLAWAMNFFEANGLGLLIYLRQEGRGIGLFNKILAYALQDGGMDTVEANEHLGLPIDARRYGPAAEIIRFFEIESVRLLTNNPAKLTGLRELGITVSERVPVRVLANSTNRLYLETKIKKMNHT
jgi:GTP cyclohydrolase II